ncbi:hypothetical protein DRF60_06285 [Chryseobacterium elymi]|uniref:Secretion system C-terminal sorting domain-containing protein n=1 Tax=Chryseobacterium elymi TaxID=395936 RepID=A0A3D9DNS7_9FLAO|nr:hypothetical protein DRF60_06285 [Chryseobacterium elymi]
MLRTLNVSNLEKGTYILKYTENGMVSNKKVIKE